MGAMLGDLPWDRLGLSVLCMVEDYVALLRLKGMSRGIRS